MLGLYHITMERDGEPGEGMAFTNVGEIEQALDAKAVTLHAKIKARYETVDEDGKPIVRRVETTPGPHAAVARSCRATRRSVSS